MQEQEDNSRHAELRMAAEVLVQWMHARRATWSTERLGGELGDLSALSGVILDDAEPSGWSPSVAPPPSVYTVASPIFAAPPALVEVAPQLEDSPLAFDITALLAEPPDPAPEAKKWWERLRIPTQAVLSVAAPFIPKARRAAPAISVLAVVIGAGWMALPYVVRIKTWVTESADKATAPDREPVVAKPAPPRGTARTGQLVARSEPPGAKVLIDGRQRGVTPLTLDDLTIGSHTVVLQSEKGSVRRTVTVASDRAAVVSEAIFAGWLSVFAPFELQITDGTHVVRLDESGKALLAPGPHDLRLENRDLGYGETRRVDVQPGQTTSLSLVAPPSTLTVTANSPAVVLIDGQEVGDTPLMNHPIPLGTRDIVVRAGGGLERRFTQKVTVAPVQIDVDFSRP